MYTVIREKIIAYIADMKGFIQYTWRSFWSREHSRSDKFLIFGLALVFGLGCKVIAVQTFTIGYQDYTLHSKSIPTLFVDTTDQALKGGPVCEE